MSLWIHLCRVSDPNPVLFREDKNTMWDPQRQPPGCKWSTGPPTSRWTVHPYMWRERSLWTHAVPRQHRTLLVRGPKRTGDPWDSLWAWQQTNVWVNHMCLILENKRPQCLSLCINRPNMYDQWRVWRSVCWPLLNLSWSWFLHKTPDFSVFISGRYWPRWCATTCWTHPSTWCPPPASRNTPVVCPERQDRARPAGRLCHEKGRCQGCPPSPRKSV